MSEKIVPVDRSQSQHEGSDLQQEAESLFDCVMSNEGARDAFYNTTEGVLAGRRDDDALLDARALLDKHQIAYFFTADASRPRPMFFTRDRVVVGVQAIESLITQKSQSISA